MTAAVAEGLAAVIEEHRAAVAEFGTDTRNDTLERAAEKIRSTRFKVQAYAEYLSGEKAALEESLEKASDELRAKVEKLAGEPVTAPAS